MEDLPNVSILMPTYNRRKFLPLIMTNLYSTTYPKNKLECIILDDHKNPLFLNAKEVKIVEEKTGIKIIYHRDTRKHYTIGEKRNKLVKLSNYKICINMDDDDIYLPQYIEYSVGLLKKNNYGLVGSAEMLFVYPHHNWKMTGIKCEALRQIHEATMCYTKKYFKSMGGFTKNSQGEGASMVDFAENQCGFSECGNCMVCVCHKDNTIDKEMFNDKDIGDCKLDEHLKEVVKQCIDLQ